MVALEKIQKISPFSFLGFSITKNSQLFTFKFNVKDKYTITKLKQ